jgi:hypothetical protein
VAKVETAATWVLLGVLLLASFAALDAFRIERIAFADWSRFFLPFGVFLFALSGLNVVSEVVELTGKRKRESLLAVTAGTLIAAAISWIFGVSLAFANGGPANQSPESLMRLLPMGVAILIPIIGFLAIVTSYITTAQDLKATLHLDFGAPKILAWFAALFVPFSLLFVLTRDFLATIDLLGAVFGGINGILVALIAWKIHLRVKQWSVWHVAAPAFTLLAYLAGMAYKLFR